MLRTITSFGGAALLLLGAFSPRVSSAELASLSVSVVVQEICLIRADVASPIAEPGVSCLHGEPYSVTLVPLDPTQTPYSMRVVARGAPHAVWMVSF
jgi:hypothetical protein